MSFWSENMKLKSPKKNPILIQGNRLSILAELKGNHILALLMKAR